MHIIRARDHRAMPWKNGGGVTYEVAVFPQAARSLDAFDWRVSMARIESDGPFSSFPGIDRSLALMEGDGLVLTLDGAEVEIGAATPVASFSGEVAAAGKLTHGPVTDLNVMTRRSAWRHRLAPHTIADRGTVIGVGDPTILIVHTGTIAIKGASPGAPLTCRDALVLSAGEQARLQAVSAPAEIYRIDLARITPA
jgi:uncharacterized protein